MTQRTKTPPTGVDGASKMAVAAKAHSTTQAAQTLRALQHGWTCGSEFASGEAFGLAGPILRYSARIRELRELGWWIERRTCQHPWHSHNAPMFQWRIAAELPGQGQLFGELR